MSHVDLIRRMLAGLSYAPLATMTSSLLDSQLVSDRSSPRVTEPPFTRASVRAYYDAHTSAFVRRGQGGAQGAIHRAVWGPGVTTRAAAFRYLDDLVAADLATLGQPVEGRHVIDLGCGVGGSLCHLAAKLPVRATGITVSAVQAAEAGRRVRAAGLADRVTIVEGDYCEIPPEVGQADLAFAIESFVHGPEPAAFLEQCRRIIRGGGLLVIADDFVQRPTPPEARSTLDDFRRGWHINTLIDRDALTALAERADFDRVRTVDLTPWLELDRPRDRVIALAAAVLRRVPRLAHRFAPQLGGTALQTALKRGWITFDYVVFRRRPVV